MKYVGMNPALLLFSAGFIFFIQFLSQTSNGQLLRDSGENSFDFPDYANHTEDINHAEDINHTDDINHWHTEDINHTEDEYFPYVMTDDPMAHTENPTDIMFAAEAEALPDEPEIIHLVFAASECPDGFFKTLNASFCTRCSTCKTGQYNVSNCRLDGDTVCSACTNPLRSEHSTRFVFTGVGFNGPNSCPFCCSDGMWFSPIDKSCWGVGRTASWAKCGIGYACPNNSQTYFLNPGTQSACRCNRGFVGVGGWNATVPRMTGQITPPSGWDGVNCKACPAGKYNPSIEPSNSVSNTCIDCGVNTYSTEIGQTNSSACLSCPEGKFSLEAATSCTECSEITSQVCSPGQYNLTVCRGTVSVCMPCDIPVLSGFENRFNFTGVGEAGSKSCSWCCNEGFYMSGSNYGSISCIGVGISASWAHCGVRYYCPENSQTYTVSPGSQTACTCNAGFTGLGGWSTTWQHFPQRVQLEPPANWSGVNCERCTAGKYSSGIGVTSSNQCLECPIGTYSNISGAASSTECIPCTNRTYSDIPGATGCFQCDICPVRGLFKSGCGGASAGTCEMCDNV